jgi:hypothetical protein
MARKRLFHYEFRVDLAYNLPAVVVGWVINGLNGAVMIGVMPGVTEADPV